MLDVLAVGAEGAEYGGEEVAVDGVDGGDAALLDGGWVGYVVLG